MTNCKYKVCEGNDGYAHLFVTDYSYGRKDQYCFRCADRAEAARLIAEMHTGAEDCYFDEWHISDDDITPERYEDEQERESAICKRFLASTHGAEIYSGHIYII